MKATNARNEKPKVRKEFKALLKARKAKKQVKPTFLRQEHHVVKSLKKVWRRPRGKHSKLRMMEKARGKVPKPGFGSPISVRGLNRLGYREVIVSNLKDLQSVNPKEEMAVIASGVGRKKREEMITAAKEKKIAVSNANIK